MLERLAYVMLIVMLAIVGIAMGAHSSTPAGHSSVAPASMSDSAMAAEHQHASPLAPHRDSGDQDSVDAACVDCAGDHTGLMMACVFLALIVVVSVVLPAVAFRFGLLAPGVSRLDSAPRQGADPRPPDLAELCINRQ